MRHQILCRIILVVLLAAPLTDAALDRAALMRQFFQSRQARSVDGHAKPDPWADPASSFGHLPTKCEKPSGSKAADRIKALPGQPRRVNFRQYAGYVTVNEEHGRELFYYFVESPHGAASKPLVLWINGPAGCSSLGIGAMTELGPFRVNRDGKTLRRNKHAWNNVANVIFLELTPGIGFSYSKTTSDYDKVGDLKTAVDAYLFMLHWLERFPEYKGRDFYIAGEDYGGHHVPQLAAVIEAVRVITGKNPTNLKGIIVGNPELETNKGNLEFMWNHGMISDEVWANFTKRCTSDQSDDILCGDYDVPFDAGHINWFNIYAPICLKSPHGTFQSSSNLPGYDPCIDNYVKVYFNNPEVQKAIHARINTRWSLCTNLSLNWDIDQIPVTIVPTLSWLVETGRLRVWLYSGDMSIVGSLTATRYAVKHLKLAVTKSWRPWYTPANEVGGYIQQYKGGFTFASVRGAGSGVSSFQPERSLVLFKSFLKGMLPPMSTNK
ncbi:hypothetical protein ACP70R_006253 [Stipagrostis hirtigluma subsp. patula]